MTAAATEEQEEDGHSPFMKKPFCIYKGHTADLLDLSWSKVSTTFFFLFLFFFSIVMSGLCIKLERK